MQTVTACSWHLHRAQLLSAGMTDSLPGHFSVVVVGTGLVESMVAAAAARQGHTVLHLDTARYYGGDWAAFTWEGLQSWVRETAASSEDTAAAAAGGDNSGDADLEDGEELLVLTNRRTVSDVKEFWSCDTKVIDTEDGAVEEEPGAAQETVAEQPEQETKWSKEEILKQSRKFNIDLTPRLLFSRGDMVELLISSNISRYTEFKSVTRVLTRLGGRLEQVPSSRSDVFNTKQISVVEKRILMKFLTQCMQETEENAVDPGKSFGDYLKQQKLTPNLMHYVSHSIAMVPPTETATKGLAATRKFLSSLGRFGPTPFLWSMYGTGELPQVLPIFTNSSYNHTHSASGLLSFVCCIRRNLLSWQNCE